MSIEINEDFNISTLLLENRDDVPILEYVLIDESNWGKIELLCNKYYGDIKYAQIVMDFNDITDVCEMNIGDVIKMPDISNIMFKAVKVTVLDDVEENIPGVNESTNNLLTNKSSIKKAANKVNKTVANPKLNISQSSVSYDKINGKMTF